MKSLKKLICNFVINDAGGETIEYALVLGLLIVVAIAIIGTVGEKVVGRWTSTNSSL